MSFLFGTKKQKEHSFLVCSIESGAVYVALVLAYPNSKPFIVHSVSKAVPFQETPSHERLTATTLQALVDACNDVLTQGIPHVSSRRIQKGHIDAVYCVYGSPWYISQTQTVTIEKNEPVVITKKILSELVEQHVSVDALRAVLSDEQDAAYILEQNIVGVRLNGYATENPIDKEAKHVSFSVSSGAVSNRFRLYVEESISRFFPGVPFVHHCSPTMEFFGIRDAFVTEQSFFIVDVSAEVTDVSVVRAGVLQETATFPFGTRSALRSFALSAGILPSEALGITHTLQAGKLATDVTARYIDAAEKTYLTWKSLFEKTLLELGSEAGAFSSVFVLGESSDFVNLQKLFMPMEKSTNPHTGAPFTTTVISGDTLKPFCLVREGVRLSHPLLAFVSLYVHKTIAMTGKKTGVQ